MSYKCKIIFFSLFALVFLCLSCWIATNAASINDKVLCITNPLTKAKLISDLDGNILLNSIDPEFESIDIIRDILSGEVSFLFKNYKGEHPVDTTEGVFDEAPSSRVKFYDLNGREIEFETENFLNAGSIENKILCSCTDKLIVFDTISKEKTEFAFRAFTGCGDVILLYDDSLVYPPINGIIVLDKELNEIKRYDEYRYVDSRDSININNIQYRRIRKLVGHEKYVFNILTKDGDKLFSEDFENVITFEDGNVQDLLFGNVVFKYDFANQIVVSTPSIIDDNKRNEIINDTEYARLLASPGMDIKDFYPDENTEKIKSEIISTSDIIVYKLRYGDKMLYMARYNDKFEIATVSTAYGIEEREVNTSTYNIYDNNANLLFENVADNKFSPRLKDYGYLRINDAIYDFDMNKIIDYDKIYTFSIIKINNKTYFYDDYVIDKRMVYIPNNAITIYDDKFNTILSDMENFSYWENTKLIIATDKESTKIYDDSVNLLYDLKVKVDPVYNYNDNYHVFEDMATCRYGIVDSNGNIRVSGLKNISQLAEDYFVYQNGFKYGVMDYNGNVKLSFSIFDALE